MCRKRKKTIITGKHSSEKTRLDITVMSESGSGDEMPPHYLFRRRVNRPPRIPMKQRWTLSESDFDDERHVNTFRRPPKKPMKLTQKKPMKPKNRTRHPTYIKMTVEALRNLPKTRKGSSRPAISKYISTNYPNLPSLHRGSMALFNTFLRRAVRNGIKQNIFRFGNSTARIKLQKSWFALYCYL